MRIQFCYKKYSRVIEKFAETMGISLDKAFEFFYHSDVYHLMHEGISDIHCMSDGYLVEELQMEYKKQADVQNE